MPDVAGYGFPQDPRVSASRASVVWSEVDGDVLAQDVAAFANPWNRNFVPRHLLWAHGVSGQLKRRIGPRPWRALAKRGLLPLGGVFITGGGRIEQDLIHVAGLNMMWQASVHSVTLCVENAVAAAWSRGYDGVALPLIGSGSGGLTAQASRDAIVNALDQFREPAGDIGERPALRVVLVAQHGKDSE